MLKIVIGTNEGKVLCISNNEDKMKASMVNYLIDTDQEPTEDFFESQNWGEYDIEVYEYHQPQLNENQQIVFEWLKKEWSGRKRHSWLSLECIATLVYHWQHGDPDYYPAHASPHVEAYGALTAVEHLEVLQVFIQWVLEQEEE